MSTKLTDAKVILSITPLPHGANEKGDVGIALGSNSGVFTGGPKGVLPQPGKGVTTKK
jgi:hypothetical protein